MRMNSIKSGCISLLISGIFLLSVDANTASAQNKVQKDTKVIRVERTMKGDGEMMIPGLTQEQQTKMKDLRSEHMKATRLLKAQHAEKAAHLKTLTLVDNYDSKAINKTIDEMMTLKGEMLKRSVAFKQAVKEILTPEQLKEFQSHMFNMKRHRGGMPFNYGQMMGGSGNEMQFGRDQAMRGRRGMAANQNMPGRERMDIHIQSEGGSANKPDTNIVK